MRKKTNNNHGRRTAAAFYQIFALRRRHQLNPFLSAFSCCLLLVIAVFSFITSPHPNISHPQLHSHRTPTHNVAIAGRELWQFEMAKFYHGCSNSSLKFTPAHLKTHRNRFLLIATSGGLNQQRTGITDAVVVAYMLNATLVIPKLDHRSFWRDSSDFSQIFDADHFISYLSKDVKIIKQLPKKGGKSVVPYSMRVPRKCTPKCYNSRVLPVFSKRQAVQLGKYDYRLSNRLDTELQKLRCRVNYHALKFTDPILELGTKLITRMRMKSSHFIALHLRFEPDMLAFSGCYYGGGDRERRELGSIRKRWKTLHVSNPEKERRHGRCPLTPEEVGLMLRALGFGPDVHIYVASGEVYGGNETLAPLKALFPNFYSKETIASKEELASLSSFSSRMAAVDFVVCDESDVFVSNNNGNMVRMLAGRRRYFGHKPTIRPNAKKLYKLFMNRTNITWEQFASKVWKYQTGFMGKPGELRPGRGEFHENPSPCVCKDSQADITKKEEKRNNVSTEQLRYANDAQDSDYVEKDIPVEDEDTDMLSPDEPELDELFSD